MRYNAAGEPTTVTDPTGPVRAAPPTTSPAGSCPQWPGTTAATTYANPVTTTTLRPGRPGGIHIGLHRHRLPAAAAPCCARSVTAIDAAGRPTQTTSAEGRPTLYGYDTAGQLTTVTQRVDPAEPATAITVRLGL